jgi:hypothetical protein
MLFYYAFLNFAAKLGDVKFENEASDASSSTYYMSINSSDFPVHHVTWFDLSQLVDKIELSQFYICDVV